MKKGLKEIALVLALLLLAMAPAAAFTLDTKRIKDLTKRIWGSQLRGPIHVQYDRVKKNIKAFTGHTRLAFKCHYKGMQIHFVHSHCRSIQEAEALGNMFTRALKRKSFTWIDVWKLRKEKSGKHRYWIAEIIRWEFKK